MSEEAPGGSDLYTHSWLSTPAAIAAEAAAWDRIVDGSYGGNPFLTTGWLLLWLRHFGGAGRVCFLKVERRGDSAAYFPFILLTERFHGLPLQALRFAANMYSAIQCPIVARGVPPDLFDHVVRRALPELPWTVFLAENLPLEHAGPAELHGALCAAGHESHLLAGTGNWHLACRGETAAAYLAARPRSLRKTVRHAASRLAELGNVDVQLAADHVTEEDIATYRSVYDRSWKEPELDPTFHPAMMRWASDNGCLRLFTLRAGGHPIAAQLWLCRAGRAYGVKSAYDEAHRTCSPGNLLMARSMAHLLDGDGVSEVDLLKGDEPYKRSWCDSRRQRMSLVAFSRDAAGLSAGLLDRHLLPWTRRHPWLVALKSRAAKWR